MLSLRVGAVSGMGLEGVVFLILVGLYLRLLRVILDVLWGLIMGAQATVAVRVGAIMVFTRVPATQTLLEALFSVDSSERWPAIFVRVRTLANGRVIGFVVRVLCRRGRRVLIRLNLQERIEVRVGLVSLVRGR